MFRLGLVTYLVMATFAGPCLCCCTAAHLATSLGMPATENHGKHAPPKRGCCHPPPSHDDKAPAQKPNSPQCPCKQDRAEPVLSSPELDGSSLLSLRQLQSDWVPLPLLGKGAPALTLSALRSSAGDHWLLPFLSTRDILFNLHMLRC